MSSSQIQSTQSTDIGALPPTSCCEAFQWLRSERIPSLNLVVEEYRHKETGARHFHLNSDNQENVFLVALRTVPMDSTGVAHILEHTALCGSEKFPVRDPFFMMIRRSLNTFMNAFTSSDWTAYPFASKNRKDYFNLLNVYLDAVFFATLDELDFAQEGHRLEFADPSNSDSQLLLKGVVFNEMKGAMSSPNSILWQTICKHLFPTTTYHYNSGGEPDHIPDLSYDQLRQFYKHHYHPSNAVFMTYGDIPAAEIQEQIETLALNRFQSLNVDIKVVDEKRYLAPFRVEEFYPNEEEQANKTHVVVGWLLGRSFDLKALFRSQLLSSVLLDNSASPLLHILETSELGSSPSPMCGLEDSNREMSFLCGLEGCDINATDMVESLILTALESIAKEGVPQEQIEAALHQLELHQREITGDSYPYGLQLILSGLSSVVHRGDPVKVMNIDPVLEDLRTEIQDRQFIPQLIKTELLNNQHRLTLTLKPDNEMASRQSAAEMQRLNAIRESLDDDAIARIIAQSNELSARQAQEDDPDILPKVGLEDIPATIEEPRCSRTNIGRARSKVTFYGQGTNGLCYQQVVFEVPDLDNELLSILPYYTSCLPEFGVAEKDYRQTQVWQSQVSGGVDFYTTMRAAKDDVQKNKGVLVLSGKALQRNHSELSQLLHDTASKVRFDEESRLLDLIEQISARKESAITGQGHALAMTLASSQMSPTTYLSHHFSGLESIRKIKSLRGALKENNSEGKLLEKFASIHAEVTAAPRQFLLIGEPVHQSAMFEDLENLWAEQTILKPDFRELSLAPCRQDVRQAWITSTQVNFCAKAYPTVPSGHPDFAPLTVLAAFLRNGFLHRTIREQGGAYGAGAEQDPNSGSFRFYSYRDPRLEDTLLDFDRAIDWVINTKHAPRFLEEAILGIVSSMDKPSSPAGEARRWFYNNLFGRNLQFLTQFRSDVLRVTIADLQRAAETWLKPESASIGLITNRDTVEACCINNLDIIKL